jgi:hypothetical protein
MLDALAAAEALTNYELAFLFNPQRANRLVQFKARFGTLGFDDVVRAVLKKTWESKPETGLNRAIQLQNQQMVVTWLLGLTQHDNTTYAVKATCFEALNKVKKVCASETAPDAQAHAAYIVARIEKPKDISLPVHKELPPGAPIGCD